MPLAIGSWPLANPQVANPQPPTANSQRPTANSQQAYTLLESLIALSIFMVVVVPLLARMTMGAGMSRAQDSVVASGLIEQTAVSIELYPDEVKPVENRRVGTREYEIRTLVSGSALRKYRIQVSRKGKQVAEAIMYQREEQ